MNNKKPQIKELLKVKVFQIAYIHSIQYKNTAHIKVCIFKHVERYERMGNGTLGRELREKRD